MPRLIVIIASLFTIWGVFEPWIIFTGEFEHPLIGTHAVSGYTCGFGFGSLDSSSASVTVWAGDWFSSASSDYWFGIFPLVSGVMTLLLVASLTKEHKGEHITDLIVLGGSIASLVACVLAICYYTPFVFVIHGQIDSLPINGAFLFAEDATISVGNGPLISAISTIISFSVHLFAQHRVIESSDQS